MTTGAPRWLRATASALLPMEVRDDILDDLDEAFLRRRGHPHLWYLAQVLHVAWTRPWRRRHDTSKGMTHMWSTLWQDVRYGLRSLLKSPGFTAVAVLSLALGIGLNSTIFTIVDTVLFRPLPFAEPDSVVSIFTSDSRDTPFGSTSYPDLQDIRAGATGFDAIAGHSMMFAAMSIDGENRLVFGEVVTANFFSTLGIPLSLGSGFSPEHDTGAGAHPVTVISDRLWRRNFGGRTDAIGQTLTIKSRPYTIVGVVGPHFTGMMPGVAADLWIPMTMVEDVEPAGQIDVVQSATGRTRLEQRGNRWMFLKGRLKAGHSLQSAEAELSAVMSTLEASFPISNRGRRAVAVAASDVRFHPDIDAIMRPAGAVLMGAVGLVLLIACANLASMLLARGAARKKEMALRSAIGASRARLIRQMAVESVVLAMLGGAVGLMLSLWATAWVVSARLPIDIPITFTVTTDWRLMVFTGGLALVTGLAFGVLPAFRASKPALVSALKDDATLAAPGRAFGLRHSLVAVQVAISVVLLVGGVLLVRSLSAGFRTDPGFSMSHLVTATVSMDMQGYDSARARVFFDDAVSRIRRLPGVESVSLAERLPFSPNTHTTTILVDGRPDLTPENGASVDTSRVTEDYFATLAVPLVAGRYFDARDTPESTRVAIISEAFARKYFPSGDAVGGRLRLLTADGPVVEVVGVSRDYAVRSLGEAPRAMIHFAASQRRASSYSILTRTSGDPQTLIGQVERELRAMESELVFLELGTLARMASASMLPVSLGASIFAGLAGLALMLAGIGLYGVIAFSVSRRTKEIGIRMALGSSRGHVVTRVLREALMLVGIGMAAGLLLALQGAKALSSVLLGVTTTDPVSYLVAGAVLVVVATLAAVIPARRAASVDPLVALRTL